MRQIPRTTLIFCVLSFFFIPSMSQAFPEMSRFGYFSCSTCHVSPSGGGLLTPYGRSISVEKLSTWGMPAEGLPLHGVGVGSTKGAPPPSDGTPQQPWLPSWLLLGGDLRMMQLDFQNADRQEGRWIRMQSDVTVGLVLPKATVVLSGGPRGDTRSRPDLSGKISFRQYYIKSDLGDTSLRLGRFYPKFGLGIPQHHTFVRRNLGFDQGQENLNGELTWFAETHEVTVTRMMGARKQEADGADEQGYSLGYAHFLSGKHRVGINGLAGKNSVQTRQVVGVFGSFALGEKWFLLAEENRQTIRPSQGNPYDQFIFYHRLGYEVIQGLIPSLVVEGIAPQIRDLKTRRETIGMGVQWFPRPHFDIDSMVGMTLNHSDYSFSTTAYIIGHYYL